MKKCETIKNLKIHPCIVLRSCPYIYNMKKGKENV